MDSENWIYPTSFHPCILTCRLSAQNEPISELHHLTNDQNDTDVYLAFTEKMCSQNTQTILHCDLMEANDGGKPYLFVNSIEKVSTMDVSPTRIGIKFEFARLLLNDTLFYECKKDETHRLRIPPLFHVSEVSQVLHTVVPNFYAKASGVEFFNNRSNYS